MKAANELVDDLLADLESFRHGGPYRSVDDVDRICAPWAHAGCPRPDNVAARRVQRARAALADIRLAIEAVEETDPDVAQLARTLADAIDGALL